MKKRIALLFMCMVLIGGSVMTVDARTGNGEVAYSMEKGGTQIFYVENPAGTIDKVIIEEIVENKRVADNSYKISYETVNWRAGFYIKVQNNKITSAYSPFDSVLMGSIQNASLVHNSSTKATYAFLYKMTVWSEDTGVIANISNGEIKVTKR